MEGVGISEVFEYIRTGSSVGFLLIALKFYVDRRRLQLEASTAAATAHTEERRVDLEIEKQRDGLTFSLLDAARSELAALREQVEKLRPATTHLQHFEAALEHINALLSAKDPAERAAAERSARAFLKRMQRLAEARGTITNEIQRLDSSVTLAERRVSKDNL